MTTQAAGTEKVDLYKERPQFFKAAHQPELVDLPEASFLVVDGAGTPDGTPFQDAIGALYSVAYTLKFAMKKQGRDFKVATFEGAWWWSDAQGKALPKEQWRWQLHMMVPDFIDEARVAAAIQELEAKGKAPKTQVHVERLRQGLCVQMTHIGPYDTETASIEKMWAFMAEKGLAARGPHHEVYIGDPRHGDPAKLKTLLKQPVEPAKGRGLREAFISAEKVMGRN